MGPGRFRVVVIGGVAAGMKAACKTVRERPDASVTVVEKGEFISYAGCGIPYYVSGAVTKREKLLTTPIGVVRDEEFFRKIKNVEVLTRTEALSIDRSAKTVLVRGRGGEEKSFSYDKLVIATGAAPVVPPLSGASLENIFTVKGLEDAERIKRFVEEKEPRKAVIVGGGLIGMEMAESLADLALDVSVVEMLPRILPILDEEMALLVEKHLDDQGITVLTGSPVRSFEGEGRVRAVKCDGNLLEADMVLLAMGVKPDSALAAEAGLAIGRFGGIVVDERMRTSDPDIYAAGDCVETIHRLTGKPCYIPLGSTANKQGRTAAVNLCGGEDSFPGVLGSTVAKVCDFCVARTGLGEGEAREAGFDAVSCLVPAEDRSHYFPGAAGVLMKVVADRKTGRLLGVQAVGPGEAAKRVDTAVAAVTAGLTVDQIAKLDLCYAPPYATPMDCLITAADVLGNKIAGRMEGILPVEVKAMLDSGEDFFFLDVRFSEEAKRTALPCAVNVPLPELRDSLDKVPRDKMIVAFCELALRAYEASLILRNAGFRDVKVMEGGMAMWPYEIVRRVGGMG